MMAANVSSGCNSIAFALTAAHRCSTKPKLPKKQQLPCIKNKSLVFSFQAQQQRSSSSIIPHSSISSSTETEIAEQEESGSLPEREPEPSLQSESSLRLCKACGREEVEKGCNGEGRIQGGIATVPGFGWWPIKAYRPCPAFVASGGRYRRTGQSMDEVAFGRGERN